MGGRSTDEPRDGLDDTLPASEPPVDGDAPPRPSLRTPQRYQLGAELGRGGMGRVVEAFDVELGRTVALKEVLPKAGPGAARRFAREVQLTARLEHPSIVPLYDAGVTADGRPYYVMRRVSGRPLDELIARARRIEDRLTLVPAVLSAIDAVAHAHRRGVIHRDLKPANILVGDLGETIVIDWGLAKVIGEDDDELASRDSLEPSESLLQLETQIGAVFGTPGFMAPEQARGDALGPRSDVYALGATLYQLLAGKPPHAGHSATEVLDKTLTHAIIPLDTIAPGSPAELVTIVTKALAHEPAARYPHAGALGEDVRRFLAGQLVAAHRYTPLQKAGRFARRHRAALAVAALAAVAVAVMAWIGVHRIVTERDAANTARAHAERDHQAVARANQALAERHDALLVTQARALLDHNPTHAAAVLKELSPTSSRLDEARAVAQAAATRGVAWTLASTDQHTLIAELSLDGRQLLQVARDGSVRVWDLERRELAMMRSFAADTRARWLAGDKLLVHGRATAPALLDPQTNTSEPLALDPIHFAQVSASGTHVLVTGAKPGVGLFVVVDATGRELARRAGVQRLVFSDHRTLAVIADREVHELALDPAPAWTAIPFAVGAPYMPIDVAYRGRELLVWATNGALLGWAGSHVYQRARVERIESSFAPAGPNLVTVATGDGRIHFFGEAVQGSVVLPTQVPGLRLARRAGVSRLVGVGVGIIVGYELDAIVPRTLATRLGTNLSFVDDDTALAWRTVEPTWAWVDLATGRETPIRLEAFGMLEIIDLDSAGRVLVRDGVPDRGRISLLVKGASAATVIAEGHGVWARLIAGDAVVYGTGDGRVFARVGAAPPREVAKLDGIATGAVGMGPLQFAAYSSGGELVRGDLRGGTLERARVPEAPGGFVAADAAGRVFLATGTRLLAWERTVTERASFDKPIERLEPIEGGLAVTLRDREVHVLEPRAGAKPRRLFAAGEQVPTTSADGRLVVGVGNAEQIEVVEMPARARWNLPVLYAGVGELALAPRARRVMQSSGRHHVIWELPEAGAELAAWLDALTNAVVDDDGALAWSWERP